MTLVEELLNAHFPVNKNAIKAEFQNKLDVFDIYNIVVDTVEVDFEGNILVNFVDDEDNEIDALFIYDEEDGPMVILVDNEDNDSFVTIDLNSINPPLKKTTFGIYLDLTNLEWVTESILISIITASELYGTKDYNALGELPTSIVHDKHGHVSESVAIRGGRREKLAVIREVKRSRMTARQIKAIREVANNRRLRPTTRVRGNTLTVKRMEA